MHSPPLHSPPLHTQHPDTPARPAALHWRLLAMVYDLLPVAALWFAVATLSYALHGFEPVAPGSRAAWATFAAMLLAGFGYFGVSWRRGGQTIGMRAWRLRLAADGAARPGWGALVVRYGVAAVSLAALGLGFLWSLHDGERRTWHDIASGTRVRREQKG